MTVTTAYKARRAEGWTARSAIHWARAEAALAAAEQDGHCIVRVEPDYDYQPEPAGDDADSLRYYAQDVANLADGTHQAFGVILYVPDTAPPCTACGHVEPTTPDPDPTGDPERAGWTAAGSVWSIVVAYPWEDDAYIREVAHDLASEADVIA